MTIEQDFLAFINESERPQWYRYAIRLFVASDTFSESDVEALGLALLDGTFNNDLALNADELPGSTPNAESAKTLNAIDEIFGVNALNTDTPLEFNPTGISVVFGENGAGKSGFARIIRKAVRPDAGEEILPNVFITEANKPHAKLIYTTESDEIRSWDLSDGPNRNLSSIRFFDRPHSEMYVDRENAVTFRPYVLSLLTLLSTFSVHLSEFFKREAEVRETPRPKLAGLSAAGAVKEALEGLSATTNAEDLLSSFDFGAEEKVQLDEAQRKVAELHPEARQREIKIRLTSKSRLNSLKQKFGQLDGLASSAAIEQTRAAAHQAKAKRSAANEIAASLYEDAALAGVGEATWITMWTATEGYIRQLTDRDSYLPSFATEAPCPLCHQPLGELAAQRMDNFRAFVESTASSQADQAEKAIEQRIQSIKQAPVSTLPSATW